MINHENRFGYMDRPEYDSQRLNKLLFKKIILCFSSSKLFIFACYKRARKGKKKKRKKT